MNRRPSWGFWLTWVVVYTALDLFLDAALHGGFARGQIKGDIEGALFGATVTWLFALRKWSKSEGF